MKYKKRIISLALAVLMLAAMSIPASAATRSDSGTYSGCSYDTHTYCYPSSLQCIIEYLSSTDDWSNYRFQVKVLYFYTAPQNGSIYGFAESANTTRIANVYRSYDDDVIESATPAFYINGSLVKEYSVTAS